MVKSPFEKGDLGDFKVLYQIPFPLFQEGVKNQSFPMENQLHNRPLGDVFPVRPA